MMRGGLGWSIHVVQRVCRVRGCECNGVPWLTVVCVNTYSTQHTSRCALLGSPGTYSCTMHQLCVQLLFIPNTQHSCSSRSHGSSSISSKHSWLDCACVLACVCVSLVCLVAGTHAYTRNTAQHTLGGCSSGSWTLLSNVHVL